MKYPNFQAKLQDVNRFVPHCTTSRQMDADLKDRVFEEFNSPLGCGSDVVNVVAASRGSDGGVFVA